MDENSIEQRIERLRAECERRLKGRYELTLAQDGIEICAELTQLRHNFRELNEIQKAWHRAFNEAERRAGLDSLACVPDSAFPLHEKIDAMRAELDRLREDNERLHEAMTQSPAMRARYDDGRQEELERLRAVVKEKDRLLLFADVALYHVVRFVSGCDTESMDVIRNTWNEIKEHRAAEAAKEAKP